MQSRRPVVQYLSLLLLMGLMLLAVQQTFSSDYFEELYQLAVKLISSGHAYVDHQTAEEISAFRCNSSSVNAIVNDTPSCQSLSGAQYLPGTTAYTDAMSSMPVARLCYDTKHHTVPAQQTWYPGCFRRDGRMQ